MPYGKKDSAMEMKGSWMSKHVQNLFKEMPIDNKASALEMESPARVTKGAQEKILASGANDAFKAAIAKETPVAMNQAPTMKKGSMAYKQGEKDKDDESISGRLGKIGSNISKKDRRDESLGNYGTRTK
jgi:hypothetical protein